MSRRNANHSWGGSLDGEAVPTTAPEALPQVPQAPTAALDTKPDEDTLSHDLERHFDALVNLERYFPQMVKFAGRMCEMMDQMGKQKNFDPTKTKFGTVKWYAENQGGHVVFDFYPMGDTNPGFGKNTKFGTFNKLKAMDKRFPQVVGLCFAIASQLAKYVNSNKIYNHEIQFKGPVMFEGPNEQGMRVWKMRFQVYRGNELIGPRAIGQVVI